MPNELFRSIHRLYKRLKKIKTLTRMQSSNLSTIVNILEVFSSRLHELMAKVESEYSSGNHSQSIRFRLIAIQLALHHEHLECLIDSSNGKQSTTLIAAELQKVENRILSFDEIRLKEVISLMYFKLLHLLAKINYDFLKNISNAKRLLHSAERMYKEMMSPQRRHQFYDCRELFSKSVFLKTTTSGLDTVQSLHGQNLELLEQIVKNQSNETVLQWLQKYQHYSIWLGKLLSTIPALLEQNELKIAAYFLLVAHKVAREKDDVKVESSIVTKWMYYFFGILDRSKENVLDKFTGQEMGAFRRSFSLKKLGQNAVKNESIVLHCKQAILPELAFNCFADSIPLTASELRLCTNHLANASDARVLVKYSIEMMAKFICTDNPSHDPMDFIVHHYQMSDLLSISSILSDDADDAFNYQLLRFRHLNGMIQWLKEHCIGVFNTLATTFLTDLNEILIDLCSTNFGRIIQYLNSDSMEKDQIQRRLEHKLVELHEINLLVHARKN